MPISDFLQTVIRIFIQAVMPAAVCMAVGLVTWRLVYRKRHPGEKIPLRQVIPFALFLAYLGGLVTITLLIRTTGSSAIQWHLFYAFWDAWNHFDVHFWTLYLGNIAMFLPLGVLLPLIAKPFRRWYVTITAGFCLSLLIEAVQYLFQLGSADVDDLFCNTVGAVVGYCLCMAVLSLAERKPRRGAAYGVVPLLSAAALAGVFILYYAQPYGNLADGPTFVVDTGKVEWVAHCDLSEERREVEIYRTEPFDHDSCLAFARAFVEKQGKTIEEIYNYDDSILLRDPFGGDGFSMTVSLASRFYTYSDHAVDAFDGAERDDGQMTQEQLRAMLLAYEIRLPDGAVMTYDGGDDPYRKGWYTFTADQILEGDTLLDGTVRCLVSARGEIGEIEYNLSAGTSRAAEPILSEAEAYEKLCQGKFAYGDVFQFLVETKQLSEVHVLSCELDYILDTKGFRQPVYHFELEGLDPVFVPALRERIGL